MIPRLLEKIVIRKLKSTNKVLIILGARQIGKTTLLQSIIKKLKKTNSILYLNCDLQEDLLLINTASFVKLQNLVKDYTHLFISRTIYSCSFLEKLYRC